jgi:hypothetical protein
MSKWKAEEPKTPNEDALREEDLQYGTGDMTEEELAAKYACLLLLSAYNAWEYDFNINSGIPISPGIIPRR